MPILPGRAAGGGHGHHGTFGTALCLPCAARCEKGYTGARCERVDLFYLRGDQSQIVIISLIVAIVTLIILIVGICLCSQYVGGRGRGGKEQILPSSPGSRLVQLGLPQWDRVLQVL